MRTVLEAHYEGLQPPFSGLKEVLSPLMESWVGPLDAAKRGGRYGSMRLLESSLNVSLRSCAGMFRWSWVLGMHLTKLGSYPRDAYCEAKTTDPLAGEWSMQ